MQLYACAHKYFTCNWRIIIISHYGGPLSAERLLLELPKLVLQKRKAFS